MRRPMMTLFAAVTLATVLFLTQSWAAEPYACTFAQGAWNSNDWQLVKSARWDNVGGWIQRADHIENETPADATAEEMRRKRHAETYTSMVLKKTVKGNVTLTSTMSYEERMAPLIVIAPTLGRSKKGHPEYREHWEIVLFDEGINVWHFIPRNGKPWWKKSAYVRFRTKPKTKYKMMVRIKKTSKGKMLSVFLDGKEKFGYVDDSLPEEFHVGITACEGVNLFYDFSVRR